MDVATVTVLLYSDLRWRYKCSRCRRIGRDFFVEGTAQHDADAHRCDKPRAHELTAAEWAARGVTPVEV